MAPSALGTLKSALKTGAFARAYHFWGDEEFVKDGYVRDVIERATEASTRDFNLEVRRGGETDAKALGTALEALPMMAERRVLVVRDVPALKKDARAVLLKYLERPAPDTVLVLVSPALAKADAEINKRTEAVEFAPLTDDALAKWVVLRAEKLTMAIALSAITLLCEATGNDLPLLAGEMEKLRNFTNGAPVDDAAVAAVVGVRAGETMSDLLDCVAQRDGVRALALIEPVLLQPKTTGVSLVMALTTQTLAIGWGLAARERGVSQSRMESEFFGLLKENAAFTGRPWGEAVKTWARALSRWTHADVDHALPLLLAADRSLKDSRVSSEEQVLVSLVLSLTAGRPRRAAA